WTARAQLLLDPRQPRYADIEAVVAGLPADEATIATQIRLLQSRSFHARVMEDLGLFDDPEFNPLARLPEGQVPLEPRRGVSRLLSFLPRSWLVAWGLEAEPRPMLESEAARFGREAALAEFASRLEIRGDSSYVITLGFTAGDAEKAARIVNRIAEMFVDDQLKAKLLVTSRVGLWLEERLAALKREVEEAEAAVARYRAEHNLVAPSGAGPTLSDQELAELNKELIVARAQLAEKRAKLDLVRRLQQTGGRLDSVPEVAASPLIANLRNQETELLRQEAELSTLYGEKHPRMQQLRREKANLQAKIRAEIERIVKTLENEVRGMAARVAALERQLSGVKARTVVNREAEVRLRELERQAETSRKLYEELLARYKETREQQEIVEPDVRIVAKATPPAAPSSPGPRLFAAAGFGIFFVLGSFLALLLERMDRGLRSAREVEALLGLPTLARVPMLRLRRGTPPFRQLLDKPLSAYAESIRAIYTGLKLGGADRPPRVVLVASSLPEEGKTTIAVSLALFAARSNRRVLLVDLDLRRPSVHRALGWRISTGLVEYVAGERRLEEVVQHDPETGLHFLPIKGQTSNPTDLLESPRLRELMDWARANFDLVVLDSAPLASVTDGRLAALLADRVLFVVRWGETEEAAARDSVQMLREIGIEPAGVVFSMVDFKKHAQYRYGDIGRYYHKSQKYYVE
ncbi:MAG TPA: hypothetical protein ENJ83_06310, partial [Rhodospirillales bacterium]|nr:hypothetical protein [Rhodospirillales bacterium]